MVVVVVVGIVAGLPPHFDYTESVTITQDPARALPVSHRRRRGGEVTADTAS